MSMGGRALFWRFGIIYHVWVKNMFDNKKPKGTNRGGGKPRRRKTEAVKTEAGKTEAGKAEAGRKPSRGENDKNGGIAG